MRQCHTGDGLTKERIGGSYFYFILNCLATSVAGVRAKCVVLSCRLYFWFRLLSPRADRPAFAPNCIAFTHNFLDHAHAHYCNFPDPTGSM